MSESPLERLPVRLYHGGDQPASSSVTIGGPMQRGTATKLRSLFGNKRTPMPYTFTFQNGDRTVTGVFERRRTLKNRGIMRLYGKDEHGHRVTADIRLPGASE